jgi:glycosyltransferase involved in cell wall biosynthesis
VLHVQKVAGISGSERHLLALLPALADRGVDVRMAVLATRDAPSFVAACDEAGVESVVIPAGPDVNPAAVARLAGHIRRYRPDIVHTHLVHADAHGQLAARLTHTPAVSSVHGIAAFYRRQPYRSVRRLAGRNACRTIAISDYVAGYLREHHLAPGERVRVVRYGIDLAGWQLAPADREAARLGLGLGLGPDDFAIGIASRLIPHKGHATLLAAMPTVLAGAPRARLLVAGTGELRGRLEEAARSLPAGCVRFLGHLPDVRGFMNACDVIVFPTGPELGEGFGLAALEAMAAGRAVVASDVGPLPEVVIRDQTGILVPPDSPEALAEALVRLHRDTPYRHQLGRQAAERARDAFGLTRMVEATVAVYQEVLDHRRPAHGTARRA